MKRVRWVAAAAAACAAMVFGMPPTAHADGEAVYQGCSSAYTFTTDVNGLAVTCEPMTFSGAWVWLPVLRPSVLSSANELDPCTVPGLVAAKVGGGTLVCEAHFNGYFYWSRSI